MKWTMLSSLVVVALTAISAAQSAPAQSSAAPDQMSNQIPAGTVISAELSKSMDAKKIKPGDPIEARTAMDVLSHGKVLVPRNTKIIGHVTEAKAHSKESPDSMVGIAFDRVVMKDGRELPIQAVVQAVGRPLQGAVLASNDPMSQGADTPSARMPTVVGGAMGGSRPSRSPMPASSYPADPASGSSPAATLDSTVAPLAPTSQGVVGIKELSLKASGQASVISSQTENVRLGSGTQLILWVQ